jgi:uncharacterized cupin superfamily protein
MSFQKVNTADVEQITWGSPKGNFGRLIRNISLALGRDAGSTDLNKRHPFDLALTRIPAGKTAFPYHSHAVMWEFYLVVSGTGVVRDADSMTQIGPGDAFLFKPGEAHTLINTGTDELAYFIIADNPMADACHYPDSGKWMLLPERRIFKEQAPDYWEGEE